MKYMNLKRFASLVMTGAMALALAAPAGATTNTETVITGTYSSPTIAVTVPTTGKAFINPFGLDMKLNATGGNTGDTATISGQQIVTAPMFISNESEMTLKVGATVSGEAIGDVRFATASAKEATNKSVFVYLQAEQATDLTGVSTGVTAANKATAYAAWEPRPYSATTDIVVGEREATGNNLVVLKAADVDTSGENPVITYKAGSIAMVRLSGDCPAQPRDAWVADQAAANGQAAVTGDGFTVTVAYTFSPVILDKYDITKGSITKAAAPEGGSNDANVPTAWSVDVVKAAEGDTVTISVTKAANADYLAFTITGPEGSEPITIAKSKGTGSGKDVTFSFTMPAYPVTINGTVDSNAPD